MVDLTAPIQQSISYIFPNMEGIHLPDPLLMCAHVTRDIGPLGAILAEQAHPSEP